MKRTGLGVSAFYNIRYDDGRQRKSEFCIKQTGVQERRNLDHRENFGCGSSREHAPWAILDMGIRCIIAPSFADIFFNNSFKNGILPIELPQEQIDELMAEAKENPDALIEVDLEKANCNTW